MRIDRELSLIVAPLVRKKVRVFWKGEARKFEKLYSGLRAGSIQTDRQAAIEVFGEPDKSVRFRTLRSRFRERLLNSLFFLELNPERQGSYGVEVYKLHRLVFFVQVLAMVGARQSALWLCERALRIARHYHNTYIEIGLLDFLRKHYAITGRTFRFNKYSQLLEKAMKTLEAEHTISRMHLSLSMEFVRTAVPRVSLLEKTEQYSNYATEVASQFKTYTTTLESIRINILHNQLSGNYLATLKLCEDALNYFQLYPDLTPRIRIGEITLNRLESYLYLRNYEAGSQAAQDCRKYFAVGSNNWFVYMEYYFLLAMHTLRFERATEIYKEVTTHPRFSLQQEPIRERWRVFKLCLNYANRHTDSEQAGTIDVNNLLQTVPIYTKDKQGFNVPILVMHILLLLERGDLDAITQRMEALKTYRTRYLRAKTNRHSALFFKLLTIMEQSSFNYEVIKRKGAKYYQQLKTSPSAYTEVHEGVQILSYAWLWERVLERLEAMQHKLVIAE